MLQAWYGGCGDTDCDEYQLRNLESNLYIASAITNTKHHALVYTPTAPDSIQVFSTMKCGFPYELIFKLCRGNNFNTTFYLE